MNASQQICLDAAKLIEQYGFVRRNYGNRLVGFCLLGAISDAVRSKYIAESWRLRRGRFDAASDLVRDVLGHPLLGNWNDSHEPEDVIDLLVAAAYYE